MIFRSYYDVGVEGEWGKGGGGSGVGEQSGSDRERRRQHCNVAAEAGPSIF